MSSNDRWESFDEEDSVDYLEVIRPHDASVHAGSPATGPSSKPAVRRRTGLQGSIL
jgi:hypothetical protein